jgi:acetolactate synthase-1/2/3 large subunit
MVEHSEIGPKWTGNTNCSGHEERARKLQQTMASAPNGSDGRLHPNKVLSALQEAIGNDSVVITDGGDFLAFGRVGLNAPLMLDPGPFGCIGIGVPYGIAASLAFPDKPVVVATGDGAYGFNAIEVDTAVRHKAPVLIVVANNGAGRSRCTIRPSPWQGRRPDCSLPTTPEWRDRLACMPNGVETEQLKPAIEHSPAVRLTDMVVTPEASDGKTGRAWVPTCSRSRPLGRGPSAKVASDLAASTFD